MADIISGNEGKYFINNNYSTSKYGNTINTRNISVNKTIQNRKKEIEELKFDETISTNISSAEELIKVANDVIAGKYGSGEDRKKELENMGYDYSIIQLKVNDLIFGTNTFDKAYEEYANNIKNNLQETNNNSTSSATKNNISNDDILKKINNIIPNVVLLNVNALLENKRDFKELSENMHNAKELLNGYVSLKEKFVLENINLTYEKNINDINNSLNNSMGSFYHDLFDQQKDKGKILGIFGSKETVIGLNGETIEYDDKEIDNNGIIKYYSSSHNEPVKEVGANYVKINYISYEIMDTLNINYSNHHQYCSATYYNNGCFTITNENDIYYFNNDKKLLKIEKKDTLSYYLNDGSIITLDNNNVLKEFATSDGKILSNFNDKTNTFCTIEDKNYVVNFNDGNYFNKSNSIVDNEGNKINFTDEYDIKEITLNDGTRYGKNELSSQMTIKRGDGSYKNFYEDGALAQIGNKDYNAIYDHQSGHILEYNDNGGATPKISYFENQYRVVNSDSVENYYDNGEYKIEYSNGEFFHYNADGTIKFAEKILEDGSKEHYENGKLTFIHKTDGTHISYLDDGTYVISYPDNRAPEVHTIDG